MRKVKITALRKTEYRDLSKIYENPISNPCCINEGDVFISENATIPPNFCESAWKSIFSFVLTLACGGGNFFDGWMKDEKTALVSCNDGFRPVSFFLEVI